MGNNQEQLIVVYKAPTMIAANMVRGLLENANIPVIVRSLQIPMYNDVAMMHSPVWGEILVAKKSADRAIELLQPYLESIEEGE